jgi:hypothetical protein
VGKVDKQVIEKLRDDLARIFNKDVSLGEDIPEPDYAFKLPAQSPFLATGKNPEVMMPTITPAMRPCVRTLPHSIKTTAPI